MNKNILLIAVLIIILAGVGYFYQGRGAEETQVCTLEAKICPDGSAVGRTGPNCEFAACPEADSGTEGWKTSTDSKSGVSFLYPEDLGTTYITTVDWPPMVQLLNEPFSCTEAGTATAQAGKTEERVINGASYCVTTEAEGAAGSTYLQYAYAKDIGGKTLILTFTTREVQCANYDDPQKTQCEDERGTFSIDQIIGRIFSTLKVS